MRSPFDFQSLPVRMILGLTLVIILTAVVIGVPAIWIISNQLRLQAWAQVSQAQRASQAFYRTKARELENLAVLTSQRPTFQELLEGEDRGDLAAYLETLRRGAGVDLLAVCDSQGSEVATSGLTALAHPCESLEAGYSTLTLGGQAAAWLSEVIPVDRQDKESGSIIVGARLGDEFATQLLDQTGLDHIIWLSGSPVGSSFGTDEDELAAVDYRLIPSVTEDGQDGLVFELSGVPFYSLRSAIAGTAIESETSLNVAPSLRAQGLYLRIFAGGILAVAAIGIALAIFISRRISEPLVRLAESAQRFRQGDLSTPVVVDAEIREVGYVAQALEGARVDLLKALTRLQQDKEWDQHLLESIVEGILTLDEEGRIAFFSKGAERITGWSQEEILGRRCDEVFRLEDSTGPFLSSFLASGLVAKLPVVLSGGRPATLSITGARLAPAESMDSQLVLVFRDVSEEEAVHRLVGHFLANIAHEFRTPLSALAASIELLWDQAADLSRDELNQLLTTLHLGVLGLQTLVDNLLQGASIEAGRFRVALRPTDLGAVIRQAVSTMTPLLEKYGQRLVLELPITIPTVNADARRVEQVMVNLLSNASRHGPPAGDIAICALADGAWVKVQVTDRGPGIPEEFQGRLFQRYLSSIDLEGSARAGVGLGLSVVKAVVEAHGGEVGVEDRPGGGSIFWFTLPRVDAS